MSEALRGSARSDARAVNETGLDRGGSAALDRAAEGLAGVAGLFVCAGDGAVLYERRADEEFPAASVIKVPLLMTVYADAAEGRLSLDERLPAGQRIDGTGVLRHLPDIAPLTIRDHATLATIVSDNTATNRLLERIGVEHVGARMRAWGCVATRFERKMYDFDAANCGYENVATPREIGWLLLRLLRGDLRDAPDSALVERERPAGDAATARDRATADEILAVMEKTQDDTLLARYLPPATRIAHKTGSLDAVRNDAGVIWGTRPIVAVGFVKDVGDVRVAQPLLGLLGWLAFGAGGGNARGLPPEWAERA